MRRGFLLLSVLIMIAAQDTIAQQYIDTMYMWIGDQQDLHLDASATPADNGWHQALDTTSWFHIVEESDWVKTANGSFSKKIKFTVFDSGFYQIPNLLQSADFNISRNQIAVNYVPDPNQKLRAIKDIEETESPNRWIWYTVFSVIFLLLLLTVLWFLFRADRIRPKDIQYAVNPKPASIALANLARLDDEKLWQRNELKSYYDHLNFILREFISDGLMVPAREQTSRDIIQNLESSNHEFKHLETLHKSFDVSDFAKFANAFPSMDQHIKWMDFARQFVSDHVDLSTEIIDQNQIRWTSILDKKTAMQFELPEELVPDKIINLERVPMTDFYLVAGIIQTKQFTLPLQWINLHRMKMGLLTRWHYNLLLDSRSKVVLIAILILAVPLIAIFLPVLMIVSWVNKESLFSRGIFLLSDNKKLIVDKIKI